MAEEAVTIARSRREARDLGLLRYTTGKPCVRGHVGQRVTKTGNCIACHLVRTSKYDKANPEARQARQARWRERHPDKARASRRESYARNPETWRSLREKRKAEDPKAYAEWQRGQSDRYRAKRLEAARKRSECPEYRAKLAASASIRRAADPTKAKKAQRKHYAKVKDDPKWRLNTAIRNGVYQSIRRKAKRLGAKAGRKTFGLLPYTLAELMAHLEALFAEGMTWGNHGMWHIDHVVPLAAFNFQSSDDIDFHRAWGLKNLQPLWANENQKKHAKLDKPFQPSLLM